MDLAASAVLLQSGVMRVRFTHVAEAATSRSSVSSSYALISNVLSFTPAGLLATSLSSDCASESTCSPSMLVSRLRVSSMGGTPADPHSSSFYF
jgi:hypothetical protein